MHFKVFIEDSMGERLWVDNEECRYFIDNIKVSFSTHPLPFIPFDFLDSTSTTEAVPPSPEPNEISIIPRYGTNQSAIENLILDVAKEYLVRRQSTEGISRNLLKLLSAAAGILEVCLNLKKKKPILNNYYNLMSIEKKLDSCHGCW